MSYLSEKFIQVGDTFKAERETYHFHRGMTYSVSHVFNDNGTFRIFITDKFGNDIEYKSYYFKITPKTDKASEKRQYRSRLDFFWDNNESPFVFNKSWLNKLEDTEFFDLENKAHFCGKGMEGVKATISRYTKEIVGSGWKVHPITDSKKLIYTKQDYYDYFESLDMEKVKLNGFYDSVQANIDHLYFMLTVPKFDEALLKQPDKLIMTEINYHIHSTKMSIDEFLGLVASVIFDEDYLTYDNRNIVYNVIEAFELLPKSYGPTSVAKLIMGNEKKKNQHVEHLSGTCKKLKQPQAFTLADMVESFMYKNGIFVRTDDYSSSDDWRGAYEYIGSKMIDIHELNKIKQQLKS